MGGLSEQRLTRLIGLELTERGAEVTNNTDDDVRQAVFAVGTLDNDAAETVKNIAPNAEKVVCYRYNEADTEGIILVERPIDVGKLCDGLVRWRKREKDVGELEINGDIVTFHGEKIDLSKKELELLKLLYSKNGEAVDRCEARELIFPSETDGNAVDVYISYLRKKIDLRFDTRTIVTVRNKGYMLKI